MRHPFVTALGSLAVLALAACATGPGDDATSGPSPTAVVPTAGSPPTTAPAETPSAVRVGSLSIEYAMGTGPDTRVWELGPDGPVMLSLPAIGTFFGFDPDRRRILLATQEGAWGGGGPHGSGPDDLAVGDLAVLDIDGGTTEVLLTDDVVEALWAPDHRSVAYILATPETYELRWRAADGADRLLARDVTATWSISPAGDRVAFTRESGLSVTAEPGLFVVTVADAAETRLSDVDRSPYGSVADTPVWSPDGDWVALWYSNAGDDPAAPPDMRISLARADGSGARDLRLESTAGTEWWATMPPNAFLWSPDGGSILAAVVVEPTEEAPVGLVSWDIDTAAATLGSARAHADIDAIIGWDVPGQSVWVRPRGGGAPVSVDV